MIAGMSAFQTSFFLLCALGHRSGPRGWNWGLCYSAFAEPEGTQTGLFRDTAGSLVLVRSSRKLCDSFAVLSRCVADCFL